MRLCFIADANAANAISWLEYFANDLGHEVHVISTRKTKRVIKGVHTHDIGSEFKISYLFKLPKIKKLVTVIRPDLLIGYRIQSCGFLAACTGFHPLALAAQCESVVWPPNSRLMRFFCQFAIKRADWINSWSENITQNLLHLGARKGIIDTFPRGIKTGLFFPNPERFNSPASTIITTRSLFPEYHHDALIKTIPKIKGQFSPSVNYLIIGEGPTLGSLQGLARRLGVMNNVKFVGYVDHSSIPEYLRQSDVYISLISTEGVSASLLEAMACGIFPIVPDIPANRLWIQDSVNGFLMPMIGWKKSKVRGFLTPPEGYQLLVEKLVTALSDSRLRLMASEINVNMIREKASWERNMKRMEESYSKLVSS